MQPYEVLLLVAWVRGFIHVPFPPYKGWSYLKGENEREMRDPSGALCLRCVLQALSVSVLRWAVQPRTVPLEITESS